MEILTNKIIHVCWKNKDILDSKSDIVKYGLLNMKKINPDWEMKIYDNDDIEKYLQEKLGLQYARVADEHIVAKTDTWRLIKMFEEGGVYTDVDRLCNIPFSRYDKYKWVLPTYKDTDFSHDFMMSHSGNPAFSEALNMRMRRRAVSSNIYHLGPQTYMNAVSKVIIGDCGLDTNPSINDFNYMRAKINNSTFIYTYREEPPYDTVIYKGEGIGDWEQAKRDLYKEFDMTHWTGEW